MLRALGQVLFSSGLQSPRFTTEEGQGQDYEVRTYQATKWVSTSMTGMQWDVATRTGFHRLFDYIQGNNQSKVKVEMTVPVSCRVDPGAGPACESTFTLSFYIPEEHQADPPQPSDPQVFIEDRQQLTVYVRTYGGFAKEQMKLEECQKLVASLQRDGAPFREQPYYTAGYDSPMKLSNRRNEIWILKKTEHH